MRDFTPDEYSPIFWPDEKPTLPGWYVCASCVPEIAHENDFSQIPLIMFDYWDGEQWRVHPNERVLEWQHRYWFGLRVQP